MLSEFKATAQGTAAAAKVRPRSSLKMTETDRDKAKRRLRMKPLWQNSEEFITSLRRAGDEGRATVAEADPS